MFAETMEFNAAYTSYWSSTVDKSIDGTKIAGVSEIGNYLKSISLKKSDFVLDLGCSYGRMYELLATHSDHIFGVDPEITALHKARQLGYQDLLQGSAENTNMPNNFIDFIFSWAVFDVVNQMESLKEANRILKVGGSLLFTGKNDNYHLDDKLAFVAEKNAFLKGFPNRFTNLPVMVKHLPQFGFSLSKLYLFPRRGDMGLGIHEEYTEKDSTTFIGYEYLILCRKKTEISCMPKFDSEVLDSESSMTAKVLRELSGFSNSRDYFAHFGLE
jgi:SAM-dependent methyltransferase